MDFVSDPGSVGDQQGDTPSARVQRVSGDASPRTPKRMSPSSRRAPTPSWFRPESAAKMRRISSSSPGSRKAVTRIYSKPMWSVEDSVAMTRTPESSNGSVSSPRPSARTCNGSPSFLLQDQTSLVLGGPPHDDLRTGCGIIPTQTAVIRARFARNGKLPRRKDLIRGRSW
jgi:hypothetical protein